MRITLHIAGYLTAFTNGESSLTVETDGTMLQDILEELWQKHIGLRDRVVTDHGDLRPHVNVFLGGENVRRLDGLATVVTDRAEICILPSVSGG